MSSSDLCWKCRERLEDTSYNVYIKTSPWLHCHHEAAKEKPKCWCESGKTITLSEDGKHFTSIYGDKVALNFCPQCGRKL